MKTPLTTRPILTKGRKPMAMATTTISAVVYPGVQASVIRLTICRRAVIFGAP